MGTLQLEWEAHSYALQASQLANESLTAELQEKSSVLEATRVETEQLKSALHESIDTRRATHQANDELVAELAQLKGNILVSGVSVPMISSLRSN